mmetsp:Transcript_51619/g.85609  ORF Transcript_51619/g.85609 Transcript_51619/m.85609 type:complete len:233 (+) Transcript_51619:20-718(+)
MELDDVASALWYYILPGMQSKWEGPVAVHKLRELTGLWCYILPGMKSTWEGPVNVEKLQQLPQGTRVCNNNDFIAEFREPANADHVHPLQDMLSGVTRVCIDSNFNAEFREPANSERVHLLHDVLAAATEQAVANICARLPTATHLQALEALEGAAYHAGHALQALRNSLVATPAVVPAEPVVVVPADSVVVVPAESVPSAEVGPVVVAGIYVTGVASEADMPVVEATGVLS